MNGRWFGTVAAVLVLLGIVAVVRLGAPTDPPNAGSPNSGSTGEGPHGEDPRMGAPGGRPEEAERARVVSHVDGDTIRLVGAGRSSLLSPHRAASVRLLEIDAPEVGGPYGGAECFGEQASEALAELLPVDSQVWVTRDEELLDPYDRLLLYLWTGEGELVNLELVRRGLARSVLFEPNDEHIQAMRRAESTARSGGRGLWGACG